MKPFKHLLATTALTLAGMAQAAEVKVAVAANFTIPMQKIAAAFAQDSGHSALLAFGSTGKFYAQIKHGAPFALLLAADDETPARLEKEGLTASGTRFTYAMGRLVLWSRQPTLVDAKGDVLRKAAGAERLAVADPKVAPYGIAALETLQKRGLLATWQPRLVQGESIAQAYQFVASGNAALGFVALSQIMVDGRLVEGSAWVVPAELHTPLRQDAVVLATARDDPAAVALLAYLKSDKARAIIRAYGYELAP